MGDTGLPAGFETLEPFVADWVLEDVTARMVKRQGSTIAELRRFYDAVFPLGEKAMNYLRDFELGSMPPQAERLLKLMLALAEIGPAVEWYNDPRVYDGFDISRIHFIRKVPDAAAQR